ncbi:28S ribosomal protein S10, mitochondrial [Elysia marginata]|uniref:Small ribosomal subunit protein uS10m n=1 Tax=Elysia marginata TaxID=1093978 RepID=A0AAV4JJD2_9GAST|nr:28S ribosomal protein S10, mitochondrial [Elysia marginata]
MAAPLVIDAALSKMGILRLVPHHMSKVTPVFSFCKQGLSTENQDELYRQITVEVKGHNPAVLNSYQKFTMMAAEELGVNITKIFEPPRVITRMSLMKSVFVHKKHFHQYEMRTLYRVFEFKNLTGSTASMFLEYIQRNMPEGVAMKVTKHQLERFPEHLKHPSKLRDKTEESLSNSLESPDSSSLGSNSESGSMQSIKPSSSLSSAHISSKSSKTTPLDVK